MTVVVVTGFVFALRVIGFIRLPRVTAFGRLERVVVCAFGVRVRHGKLALQFDGAALGTRGHTTPADEGLEVVLAGFADEIENRHDQVGELT